VSARVDVETERQGDGWLCSVTVADERGRSQHRVTVGPADLARYAPGDTAGAADPADLVRRSFEFLLAREPKESILSSFDLPVIERYFPEYGREIRGGG